MEKVSSFDDVYSGNPVFFVPSLVAWSDFIAFIDDDTKGDLIES